jgi:hypothetical protein
MRWSAFAVLLTACVSVPPFHGATDDSGNGSSDGSIGPLAVRWIRNAYRDGGEDAVTFGTPMMSKTGYGILSADVNPGDLVLFIANVDNGSVDFWNLPTGFTKIVQRFYGADGQTYVAAWKIAGASEPQYYTGTYKVGVSSSAAATISLLAVTGYDPQDPIEIALPTDHQAPTDPAVIDSAGIRTTKDNSLVIFAAGADWNPENGTSSVVLPSGFQQLTSFGDRDTHWDWTNQVVAYRERATAGDTGPLTGTLSGLSYADNATHIPGGGWDVVFAIAPHP